jgi:pyruvate,water dikinase
MKKGNILVCHYTDSEWEPVMSMASAIVVDTGSIFSHASMIAKKLDIPCIVATGNATRTLNDNAKVTVNANTGKVIPQSIDSSR